ncbi:MAG: hypothetical protein ACYSUN_09170, partial [Planctomycetota bacterium]
CANRDKIVADRPPRQRGFGPAFKRAAGQAIPGFAAFAAALATGGAAGAAMLGYLEGASEGEKQAYMNAALNYAFARTIPLVSRQPMPVRVSALGGTFAGMTATMGGPETTIEDIVAHGLIGGSFGIFGNRIDPRTRQLLEVERVARRTAEAIEVEMGPATKAAEARMPTDGEIIEVASKAAGRVREGQPAEGSLPGGGGAFSFNLARLDDGSWRLSTVTTGRATRPGEGEGGDLGARTSSKTWKRKPSEATVRNLLQKKLQDAAQALEDQRLGRPPPEAKPPEGKPAEAKPPKVEKPPPPPKPVKEPPMGTVGDATVIRLPGRDTSADPLKAHYAVREADDLIPSHRADSFQERTDYPRGVQEREYHREQPEQAKILKLEEQFAPEFVHTDVTTMTDGPPVITPSNRVAGGNARTMTQQRIHSKPTAEDGTVRARGITPEDLKADLVEKAAQFGLDPAKVAEMKKPVLVRVLENEPPTPNDFGILVRRLNEPFANTVSRGARGIANARSLSDNSLRILSDAIESTPRDAPTIRQTLEGNREVVKALREDGIIRDQDLANLVSQETGFLSPQGMTLVEDMLLGWVVGDGNLLAATPPALQAKLLRTIPALIRVERTAPELAMRQQVQGATRVEIGRQAAGSDVELFLNQVDAFTEPIPPSRAQLVRALQLNPNSLKVKFNGYARAIEEAKNPQESLFGKPRTAEEAFTDAFGAVPDVPIGMSFDSFQKRFGGEVQIGVTDRRGAFHEGASARDAYESARAKGAQLDGVEHLGEMAAVKVGDVVVRRADLPEPGGLAEIYRTLNGRGEMPPLRQQVGARVAEPSLGGVPQGPAETMPWTRQTRTYPAADAARVEAKNRVAEVRDLEAASHPEAQSEGPPTPGDLARAHRQQQPKTFENERGELVADERLPRRPIKQEDILHRLLQAFGVSVNIGPIRLMLRDGGSILRITRSESKKRGWEGLFVSPDFAAFARKPDVGTVWHEFGHFLSHKYPELKEMFTNQHNLAETRTFNRGNAERQLRNNPILAFMRLSYDVRKPNEGFAEAWRLWGTEPDYLRGRAASPGVEAMPPASPLVYNMIQGWVDSLPRRYGREGKRLQKALLRAQKETLDYFEQGSLAGLQSKVGKTRG